MPISGSITIKHKGKNHTIQANDFTADRHLDGTSVTHGFDTGDYAIDILVEHKDGAMSHGDWNTENCTIVTDNISIS